VATRGEIFDFAVDEFGSDEGIIVFDGLEDAFVGIAERFEPIRVISGEVKATRGGEHRLFAVYSYDRIIEDLMKEGMDEQEAVEFYDFNIAGTYAGESTPAIIRMFVKE
jgi:hypothetical protein